MLALTGIAIDANENAIRGVVVLIFARPETNQRNDADGQRAEEKQFDKPVHTASVDRANAAKPGVIGNETPGCLRPVTWASYSSARRRPSSSKAIGDYRGASCAHYA